MRYWRLAISMTYIIIICINLLMSQSGVKQAVIQAPCYIATAAGPGLNKPDAFHFPIFNLNSQFSIPVDSTGKLAGL